MDDVKINFEQARKILCQDLAYFLRDPKLSEQERFRILGVFQSTLQKERKALEPS